MFAEFDIRSAHNLPESRNRDVASWRGIVSAWVLVALIVIAFTGLQAAALLSPAGRSVNPLTGAIIPRYDPACAAPLISSAQVPSHCRLPTNAADQQDWLLTPGT
jgi:hypothetical protein